MKAAPKKKIRVLFTRHFMEGHDIGLRSVVSACRKFGMEVVYYHRFQDVSEITKAAEEEDVDLVGVSSSSGAHISIAEGLISSLSRKGLNIPVIMGGIISHKDIGRLEEMGVKGIFGPGSTPEEIVRFLLSLLDKH